MGADTLAFYMITYIYKGFCGTGTGMAVVLVKVDLVLWNCMIPSSI